MRFQVKGLGEVEVEGLPPCAVPALRLVQYHAPTLILTAKTASGTLAVRLGDVDLAPSFRNQEQPAKTGG